MKFLNLLTLLLIIVGGINWGAVGRADYDIVAHLFGGEGATISRVVYTLVGLSALWQLVPFLQAAGSSSPYAEQRAERGRMHLTPPVDLSLVSKNRPGATLPAVCLRLTARRAAPA